MIEKDKSRAKRLKHKKQKDCAENRVEQKYKAPKNWKHLYLRSIKLDRARQLGIEYPRKSTRQMLDQMDKESL